MKNDMNRVAVVIPNWNGQDMIGKCVDSLLNQQSVKPIIIVVENGSVDDSLTILKTYGDSIIVLVQKENLGFAGGVNAGIKHALDLGVEHIALFNNDAVADPDWLISLVRTLDSSKEAGIATSKILIGDTGKLDSTGDWYSTTGMPFPRGRNELDTGQYDTKTDVFGASGGASLYRASLFREIGLFDEDFFAYYEDVDISFRAQLSGWKVLYCPSAIVYHALSATSNKLGYFAIRQSAKNFWFIYIKNVPNGLFFKFLPAALYRYARMYAARAIKGGFFSYTKGFLQGVVLFPKKFSERREIQKQKKVTNDYLESIIFKGKPPIPPKVDEDK